MQHYPQGHVLYRDLYKNFPTISHGDGLYLFDENGRRYLDASGGAYVVSVGHANQEIIGRVSEQMKKVAYVNGMHFTSSALEELASKLCALAPQGISKMFLLSSGSEAVEAAIKLARQVQYDRGNISKYKILSRSPSYHGNTLFALSISARKHYQTIFGPLLGPNHFVETPYEYRSPVNYHQEGGEYYTKQLENLILQEGPETVAAFIAEPVSGSSAGGSVPPADYFAKIYEICRRYDVLMIADEVLVGCGRTGRFYACQHVGWQPDIIVLGKSLNSGYIPVSAVLARGTLIEDIFKKKNNVLHAQTYMQNPAAAACALAVVDHMIKHDLVNNAAQLGVYLKTQLEARLLSHPHVGFVNGLGLLAGVEFVANKQSKQPFARKHQVAERFREHALSKGLVLWFQGGQLKDGNGDIFLMAPPLNVNRGQIDEIVQLTVDCVQSFKFPVP